MLSMLSGRTNFSQDLLAYLWSACTSPHLYSSCRYWITPHYNPPGPVTELRQPGSESALPSVSPLGDVARHHRLHQDLAWHCTSHSEYSLFIIFGLDNLGDVQNWCLGPQNRWRHWCAPPHLCCQDHPPTSTSACSWSRWASPSPGPATTAAWTAGSSSRTRSSHAQHPWWSPANLGHLPVLCIFWIIWWRYQAYARYPDCNCRWEQQEVLLRWNNKLSSPRHLTTAQITATSCNMTPIWVVNSNHLS